MRVKPAIVLGLTGEGQAGGRTASAPALALGDLLLTSRKACQYRPTMLPSSSRSMLIAAGLPARPGMVRMSPQIG